MVTPNLNQVCEQARLYYYDFLFQMDKTEIPEYVLGHFRQCGNCQKRIYELKTAITQVEYKNSHKPDKSGSPLLNILKLHFSYVDQEITCKIVRPFLPNLLDASMQINIPTPITTHLDHCHECVQDMGKISDLNLSNVNLFRLSQFFASRQDDDISCSNAQSDILAFVMMAFHESDEQTLKHLCTCSKCSAAIYQYRQTICEELQPEKSEKPCFLSSKLTNNDIFDFVIPYGLNLAQYKKSEFQQSRTSHIRRCPYCLEKIQELHHFIHDISEREDSEAVTTYNVKESEQTVTEDISENIYAGFPIDVEVSGVYEKTESERSGSIINFTAALKRKILTSNMRTISKTGFVGLLLLAAFTAMIFYSPKAKARNLAQLYTAFENSNNVHISLFTYGQEEPVQEQWVSRTSNISIFKTNDEVVLKDIAKKSWIKTKINSKIMEITPLDGEQLTAAERTIRNSMGLIPFYSISDSMRGAEWNQVTPENTNGEPEIYELTWESNTFNDAPVFEKIRFAIKAGTDLPLRIESYRKLTVESEYSIESSYMIEYLSDKDITEVQNSFFGR